MDIKQKIIFYLKFFLFVSVFDSATSTKINVINRCSQKVWVGIKADKGKPILHSGGFLLNPKNKLSVNAPNGWSGNFFGRLKCNANGNNCDSANCNSGSVKCNGNEGMPPLTLAEFSINNWGNLDFYDLSLIEGFNVPMTLKPQNCKTLYCKADMNAGCPAHLKKWKGARVVGCRSGKSPSQPKGDPQYVRHATKVCPNAYAFWNDDIKTNSCRTGGTYDVIFCG